MCFFLFLGFFGGPAEARVFYSRREALRLAFPEAEAFREEALTLGPKEVEEVERLTREPLGPAAVSFYAGVKNGKVLGYAFLDTRTVRTLPATFLVVLSPAGEVQSIYTLAFYEPQEYLPPARWLRQFEHKRLGPKLRLYRGVHGIAGATLSARAVTASVRRALALFRVWRGRRE